jgi:hypothetical protein
MSAAWEPMVSVRMTDDDEGNPVARVMFSDVALTLQPEQISFAAGVLRVAVPASIVVPEGATVVESWLPPTPEQVRLAVEALSAGTLEQILAREQVLAPEDSWGTLVRRSVALALAGDRGDD